MTRGSSWGQWGLPGRDPEEKTARMVRWGVASVSFSVVMVLFLTMDFGDRGYHFEPERAYASNVVTAGDGYDLSRLRVLTRCVGYVRANYVDPSRADALRMIVAALDDVERKVPEFLSNPVTKKDGGVTGLRIRVGAVEKNFDLTRVTDLYTMNWKLLDVFEFIAPNLSGTVDARAVEYSAVNGMLRTLDPHSVLLTPSIYREMKLGTSGKFGGLGIVIGLQDGRLVIQSVMDGTPAQRAGLKSADKIVQIGSESTMNMSLTDAVKRLRGAPGTPVTIWVARKSFAEPRKFRIVRENITLASVTSRLLPGGVAHVRIKNFQRSTGPDLEKAIKRMDKERRAGGSDGLQGLVLDLRDNPGGLLDQAIEVSDLFLSTGTIVTTVGSGSKVREEKVASSGGTWKDLPVVVLVNPGSASASEIVAGALRNNDRGVIMGTQTFGKGSVQVIYDIDDAALKLTIAQYLTPGDESIQSVGITPHVELAPVVVNERQVDLNMGGRGGEAGLTNHLENGARIKKRTPDARVSFLASAEADADGMDFHVRLARKLLLEAGRNTARETLVRARPIFALAEREQTSKLVEALGKLDIDWNAGKDAKRSPLTVEVETDRDGGRVSAGEKIQVTVKATNKGSRAVHRVRALTRSPVELMDGLDFVLGRIPAGETRTWKVTVDVPRSMRSRTIPLSVELFRGGETTPIAGAKVGRANIEVDGPKRPRFAYALVIDDGEHGNGDGLAAVGERVTLRVQLTNIGDGPAFKTLAVIRNRGGDEAFITVGRAWLESLGKGETREVEFQVEIREEIPENGLGLDLRVSDTVLHERLVHQLAIPVAGEKRSMVREQKRWRTTRRTRLLAGSRTNTRTLGWIPAGKLLRSDASVGGLLRIPLEPAGFGWAAPTGLEATDGGPITQRMELKLPPDTRQPEIILTDAPPLETRATTIRLHGHALFPSVDEGVRPDVYVFVDNDKVYFQRAEKVGAGKVGFETEIPLSEGANKIAIYARAGRDLLYKHRVYVFRR